MMNRKISPLLIAAITVSRFNTAVARMRVANGWMSRALPSNSKPESSGINWSEMMTENFLFSSSSSAASGELHATAS